ncbi:hypothetical protein CEXT_64431 [Caerostris extrusa]|uniref:Uncharacterized protein n=1 Tax=Caerostris extrusa TaxID=172846 RepID=A0AAV4PQ83_CAEEX|nr:hypothetical protein CEXT_64431 [Caerostris extrusa]
MAVQSKIKIYLPLHIQDHIESEAKQKGYNNEYIPNICLRSQRQKLKHSVFFCDIEEDISSRDITGKEFINGFPLERGFHFSLYFFFKVTPWDYLNSLDLYVQSKRIKFFFEVTPWDYLNSLDLYVQWKVFVE